MDAFGNAGHRGTDIPAPEGTPILAAHSGTVLVSGWNDSYGNQVLLDNGAGPVSYTHLNNPQPKDTKTYKLLTTKPGEME